MTVSKSACNLIDRHVATDVPDVLELNVDACLAVLMYPEQTPSEHDRARRRLRQIGSWFEGGARATSALIEALAAMDPVRRNRRRIALLAAWTDLHTD